MTLESILVNVPLPVIIMYALLIPCAALFIFIKYRCNTSTAGTIFKTVSIWIIIITALIGTSDTYGSMTVYSILIISGLVIGLAGDVALSLPEKGTLSGMFFFGLGHICYIPALIILVGWSWVSLVNFVVIYAALLAYFFIVVKKEIKDLKKAERLKIPAVIYSIIIAYMVSLTVLAPFHIRPYGLILLFAGVFFAIADGMLAYNTITTAPPNDMLARKLTPDERGAISLCCYFFGQSLFAVSIFKEVFI